MKMLTFLILWSPRASSRSPSHIWSRGDIRATTVGEQRADSWPVCFKHVEGRRGKDKLKTATEGPGDAAARYGAVAWIGTRLEKNISGRMCEILISPDNHLVVLYQFELYSFNNEWWFLCKALFRRSWEGNTWEVFIQPLRHVVSLKFMWEWKVSKEHYSVILDNFEYLCRFKKKRG